MHDFILGVLSFVALQTTVFCTTATFCVARNTFREARISNKLGSIRAKYEADIAQAIGHCQGLGHPDTYLEKRYLEIAKLKQEGDQ
jgi:hypothetical protein